MYEVYRDIKNMFFPKALYIIDKFHVVRLFTDKIQYFRIKYMKHLDSNTLEYKFLKKHWKIFVMNPWTKKFKKYSSLKNILKKLIIQQTENYLII